VNSGLGQRTDQQLEERDRKSNPTIFKMTYALLHSYAHYIMQGIQKREEKGNGR
jgi:hypothetical protein